MPPVIPTIEASSLAGGSNDAVADALHEVGAVVVCGLASPDRIKAVEQELAPFYEATPVAPEEGPDAFYAGDTKRVGNLLSKSETATRMAIDEGIQHVVDMTLLPFCENYQLHVCSSLNIGPGARAQILHREDAWDENVRSWGGEYHHEGPKRSLIVATMWALTDFTEQNGATLCVEHKVSPKFSRP
jgi:ectoine hydroxylase-related dioxygenase (phytanoyl-CoA dioxygenase family)